MTEAVHILNFLLPPAYLMAFGIYLYDFAKGGDTFINSKRLFLFVTLVIHTVYIIMRTFAFEHPPITNVFEIFTILAFTVSFSYFVIELVTDIRGTGMFIIIISLLFQTISSVFITDLLQVKEILRSNLLGFHVFSALLGYSGVTLAAVYGFLYLTLYKELRKNTFGILFERLPNLEMLELLSFYSAVFGFFALTVAMTVGIIWLPRAFPHFSLFDPKLIATALVWLMYGIGIGAKISGKWQGKKVVRFSVAGFIIAISSTIITNFVSKSFHSFY